MLKLDAQRIASLGELLDALQYDAVQRSLRPNYFAWPFPPLEKFEQLLNYLPEQQQVTYRTLLLGQPVRKKQLERAWGGTKLKELLELGLLEPVGTKQTLRTANYSIVSYLGRYFVVSLNPHYPGSQDPDAAIYIGPDSLTLASHILSLPPASRVLDLCSGSGIQAILLARTADQVVAVELNHLAAHTAKFNALLNNVTARVEFRQGNLYENVPDGPYDLVVSNPPFISTPEELDFAMCGDGGPDGLAVLRPLLQGIPDYLADPGLALIYAESVGDEKGPFVRHLLWDLAQQARLDVQLVLVSRLAVKSALILRAMSLSKQAKQGGNIPDPREQLRQWRDLYEQLGATHLFNYVLYIRKGESKLDIISAFDPEREERGFQIEPGVIVKPRD